MGDQHADRESRPNGDRRLNVQRASDDLLADLAEPLRRALTECLHERILVVVGAGGDPDNASQYRV